MTRLAPTMALVTIGLAIPAVARQNAALIPENLTPPAGVKRLAGGAYGYARLPNSREFQIPADFTAAGVNARLQTTLPVASIADHYLQQLKAVGWKVTLMQIQPSWAFIRLSAGSESEPFIGTLKVMPFAELQNVCVALDVIRVRIPWPPKGRSGGSGAGAAANFMFEMSDLSQSERPFPEFFTLPSQVSRLGPGEGGASPDHSHFRARLETFLSASALMKILEPQAVGRGWQVHSRAGDAVQAVTQFTPPPGGNSRAILALTMMPGAPEVELSLNVIRNQ